MSKRGTVPDKNDDVAIKFIPVKGDFDESVVRQRVDLEAQILRELSGTRNPAFLKFYGLLNPSEIARQVEVELQPTQRQ